MKKNEVIAFAKLYGCTTAYSGKMNTMYLKGEKAQIVADELTHHTLDFKVDPTGKTLVEYLDEYLIDNPPASKTKGAYDTAAEKFGVDKEYVRDRWRKLQKKNTKEKQLEIAAEDDAAKVIN